MMIYFFCAVVLLISVFLFLIFPSARRHPDRVKLKGMYIAHRGLHNQQKGIPENSVSAFLAAAAHSFAIENDIHITADGQVVVFHDNTLKRMCSADVTVEELTLAQLKGYRLLDTDEQIPTLKECLDAVDGRVPILVEFKCGPENCARLCQAADRILADYKGKYFIQSFYPGVLAWYKRHRKDILRGQLAMVYKGKSIIRKLISAFFLNFTSRPDFVAYDISDANRFMFRLQKLLGAFSVGWTFRSKAEVKKHKKIFKAFIFENFKPEE